MLIKLKKDLVIGKKTNYRRLTYLFFFLGGGVMWVTGS
jgi:hypothetical protein